MNDPQSPARPIGFWLVPAPADMTRLRRIVDRLAEEFDAPPFEPHVTLFAGRGHASEGLEALARRVGATTGPLQLVAHGTGHGPARFKALFIEFEDDPRPAALYRAIRAGLVDPQDYALQVHLSLLYKVLPAARRATLAARHGFAGERITFDHIAVVQPGGDDDHWNDVGAWDVRLRMPLAGS